ncbi:MAG: LamG domain-containing protein, partial [Gemmataceae bacterium]
MGHASTVSRITSPAAVLLATLAVWPAPAAAPPIVLPPRPPLVAHWTFDEVQGGLCRDASGHGWNATPAPGHPDPGRTRGVFGHALALAGRHHLRASAALPLVYPAGLSLSAWVKPTDLSGYREIFRKEDGADRVLFSFQDDGRTLSLGLNTGRYDECDAAIDPARVSDGQWHHCAATFDGRWMRVYLDGEEIGRLEQPGRVRA